MKKNVYDEIEKIKELHDQEISDIENQLHDAEDEKTKRESEADEALESGRVEEYTAARALVREAGDKVDYYKSKLDNLKTAPYFSSKERKEKISAIREDIRDVKQNYLKAICKSVMDCCDLLDDLLSRQHKANDALDVLQHNTKVKIGKFSFYELNSVRSRLDLSNMEYLKEYWKEGGDIDE